jgi:hypothetical protein
LKAKEDAGVVTTVERYVDIQLEPNDLVEASKLQFRKGLRGWKGLTTVAILAVLATTVYGLLIWDGDDEVAIAIFGVLSPLMVICGPAFVVWFVAPSTARRIFAQQASLRRAYRLEWNEQCYMTHSEDGHVRIEWGDFFRIIRNDEIIVLFESQVLRRLVPLRFLTAEQRMDIERIIDAARPY